MNNLFDYAGRCLHASSIEERLHVTADAWRDYKVATLDFESRGLPEPIGKTRFPARPRLVDARELPKRSFSTPEGLIALLHSIAHIEFTAIALAWDVVYRFRDLPRAFYCDWLTVAYEEALHFSLIRDRLRELDSDYGALPAHRGLWDVAEETSGDVLARLALVPRYLEARGLDVTPAMIERFEQVGDRSSGAILTRILEDEVGHVRVGTRWFRHVCEKRGLDPERTYFALLSRHLRGKVRGPFNHPLREAAGFTHFELSTLERLEREH